MQSRRLDDILYVWVTYYLLRSFCLEKLLNMSRSSNVGTIYKMKTMKQLLCGAKWFEIKITRDMNGQIQRNKM